MIVYLLLIVFAILMTMIALGLTIGGLVKKKQKVWISSLVAFVVFALVSVFSFYIYAVKSIDYMATDEFQNETRKKAENVGKTWGNTVSGTAEGLSATLDDEAIAKLANKSAIIVGKGVKAFAKGYDENAGSTTVFSDESVDKSGIIIGRVEQISGSEKNSFGLFLEFKKDFDGELFLTAYDSKGQKMDKKGIKIEEKAGKAKVYVFNFDYFNPGLSGYCILTKAN